MELLFYYWILSVSNKFLFKYCKSYCEAFRLFRVLAKTWAFYFLTCIRIDWLEDMLKETLCKGRMKMSNVKLMANCKKEIRCYCIREVSLYCFYVSCEKLVQYLSYLFKEFEELSSRPFILFQVISVSRIASSDVIKSSAMFTETYLIYV